MLGVFQLGNSHAEKDLGILVDSKQIISQQFAMAEKTNSILAYIDRSIASRLRKDIILQQSAFIMTRMPSFGPPSTRKTLTNGNGFSGGPPRGLGAWTLAGRGDAEGNKLVQPGEVHSLGNLTAVLQYLWHSYQENGVRLFAVVYGRQRQWTPFETWLFLSRCKRKFIPHENISAVEQVAQRACAVCVLGSFQDRTA